MPVADRKRVLIVGGGSSGWMAAAYLDAALNRKGLKVADISLVESPDVPRIGVGEATVPSINHILAVIGIEEREFMRRVEGTFKQSIKFVNWLHNSGEHYYHAFARITPTPLDTSGPRWLASDRSIPFMGTISAQPMLCEMNLAPQMPGPWDFGPPLTYAFHMNALKFADLLCEIATSRGVHHYRDHVTEVRADERGHLNAVHTQGGLQLEADLYIDCTGFAALLIEKALGVDWIDCSQYLLCDRATTLRVPYEQHYPGYVRPYTTATALSAGWVWEIPLQGCRSLGYVHSSAFQNDEDAEREVRTFEGAHADALDSRIVHFKVGHRAKSWAGNCIAIGLAGGFIEPLESTGLYLSDLATVMLSEHFPFHGTTDEELAPLRLRFNRILANRFYEILDFINLHYCLTRRRDTEFWRTVQKAEHITGRLSAKLDFWRNKPPSHADFEDQHFPGQPDMPLPTGNLPGDHRPPIDTGKLFTRSSYEAVMYGMDFLGEEYRQRFGDQRPRTTLHRHVAERLAMAPRKLPSHEQWLQQVVGMRRFSS
jgi:tryptophan 7-halogenase